MYLRRSDSPPAPAPTTSPFTDPQPYSAYTLGPGPALASTSSSSSNVNFPSTINSAASDPDPSDAQSQPPLRPPAHLSQSAALATDIQHFGKRNFVGLLVLGVFILAGLALWLTFGRWPRRMFRRLRAAARARFARGAAGESTTSSESESRHGGSAGGGGRRDGTETECDQAPSSERGRDDKVQPSIDTPSSSRSIGLEVEVEGLEKGSGEAKQRTLPRVRFA